MLENKHNRISLLNQSKRASVFGNSSKRNSIFTLEHNSMDASIRSIKSRNSILADGFDFSKIPSKKGDINNIEG